MQPNAVCDYNHGLGGANVFDQKSSTFCIRRKLRKSWKAPFFDFLEVACVNAFILFQKFCKENPGVITRGRSCDNEDFRVAIIRQIAQCAADAPVPAFKTPLRQPTHLQQA